MKYHTFDGRDPIRIFDFLARFENEADKLNISEAHAFIAYPEIPGQTSGNEITYKLKRNVMPRWHYLLAGGYSISHSSVGKVLGDA